MKRIYNLGAVVLLLVFSSFSVHKYYSSITKIEVDQKAQLLKIHTQFFAEDFETLLKERYDIQSIVFSNITEEQQVIIENYITKKLLVKANRTALQLTYLGAELEGELLYVYIESKINAPIKRLDIENRLLQDVFSEQQNTVDVTNDNQVKSLHLYAEVPSGTLFF